MDSAAAWNLKPSETSGPSADFRVRHLRLLTKRAGGVWRFSWRFSGEWIYPVEYPNLLTLVALVFLRKPKGTPNSFEDLFSFLFVSAVFLSLGGLFLEGALAGGYVKGTPNRKTCPF